MLRFLSDRLKKMDPFLNESFLDEQKRGNKESFNQREFTFAESGRTLIELLAVLALMAVLSIGGILTYRTLALKFQGRTIAESISKFVIERQHEAMTNKGKTAHAKTNIAGPHGIYFDIRNLPDRHLIEIVAKSNDADKIKALEKAVSSSSKPPYFYRQDVPALDGTYEADLYMTYLQYDGMLASTIANQNPTCPTGSSVSGQGALKQKLTDGTPCYEYCSADKYYVNNQCQSCRDVINYLADGSTNSSGTKCCPTGYDSAVGGTCCKTSDPYCVQVEYLQSSGTQYIDSGYKTGNNIIMEIEAMSLNGSSSQYHAMGYYSSSNCYAIFGSSEGGIQVAVNDSTSRVKYTDTWLNTKRTCKLSKGAFYVDEILIGQITPEISESYNIWIAGINGGPALQSGRIYSAKISDDDTLVRDFIPAIYKDGRAGMYDSIENKMYYNAGSGNFTTGPIVSE